jgi:hypothetical protein
MQRHEIPTHLDVEDKLFAGLSPRQLLLLIMGIGLGYSFWQRLHYHVLPLPLVVLVAILPGLASLALATLRPDDRPLEQWLLMLLRYHSLPKICLLARSAQGVQELDLSPESLGALEAEWQALQEAMQAVAPRKIDEWDSARTHAGQGHESALPLLHDDRVSG